MTNPIDVSPEHMMLVRDILQRHLPPGVRTWVFGSRTHRTVKKSSDLDIALEGDGKLDREIIYAVEYAFDVSDLPYSVDVVDLNAVDSGFRKIIDAHKAPLS